MRTNCKARVIPYRTKKGYSKPLQNRMALPTCAGTPTTAIPARTLQFPDICFCVASVNDKNIPVYRHFTEVCPILLYGKLLHLLVDQPLFFFRNVKLHLYISLSVFHFRTAFRYKGLGLSQQAFSANGYSFAVLAIYSIPPPKGGICCAFL